MNKLNYEDHLPTSAIVTIAIAAIITYSSSY